jgi:hypothetical protein
VSETFCALPKMADPEESQLPHERLKRSSSSPEITPNFTPSVSSAEDPVREKLNISKNERLLPPSTPWTSQPQSLSHRIPTQWWWETTVDIIMVLLPMPFYILLITVISVNGRGTEDHDLAKIEQAVKGVSACPN